MELEVHDEVGELLLVEQLAEVKVAVHLRRVRDDADARVALGDLQLRDDVDDELFRDRPVALAEAAGRVEHEHDVGTTLAVNWTIDRISRFKVVLLPVTYLDAFVILNMSAT